MGYGRTVTISTRRVTKIMLDRFAELEDGQVHRDHHAADHNAEHYHDHRFHQTGQRVDRIVDLGLEEVGDLAEHGIEGSRFLPDRHHLGDHVGEDVGFLHRSRQARPGAHLPLDLPGGHQVDVISRGAADRVERLDQGHARREHGGERPSPACDGGFPDQVAENGQLEHRPVHEHLDRQGALPQREEAPHASDDGGKDDVPVLDESVRDPHDEQGRGGEIGAEVREHLLERRNHENHDDRGDDEGYDDDRDRIEQGGFDLRLDGEDFFFVGRQAFEQGFENPGLLAGRNQVAEQSVEVKRVLPERRGKRGPGLDVGLDPHQQSRHRRVGVAFTDDVERLKERHARLHHRRHLAGKQGHVLVAYAAAPSKFLPVDLGDDDTLAAQRDLDHRLAARAHLTLDALPGPVLAFPKVGDFLDLGDGCCGCHSGFSCLIRWCSLRLPWSQAWLDDALPLAFCKVSGTLLNVLKTRRKYREFSPVEKGPERRQASQAACARSDACGRKSRTVLITRSCVWTISIGTSAILSATPAAGISLRCSRMRPFKVFGPSRGSASPSLRFSSRSTLEPSTRALPSLSQEEIPDFTGAVVVNSPMISSMMSSSVTSPCSSPYSSTTSAMRWWFSWKYWSCANAGVPAGTKYGSASSPASALRSNSSERTRCITLRRCRMPARLP